MSCGVKTFYYCTEYKWDMDCLGAWNIRWEASYIDAAKEIAKELDDLDGAVKERRQFWLKQDDHETPILMHTLAEIQVNYEASMESK